MALADASVRRGCWSGSSESSADGAWAAPGASNSERSTGVPCGASTPIFTAQALDPQHGNRDFAANLNLFFQLPGQDEHGEFLSAVVPPCAEVAPGGRMGRIEQARRGGFDGEPR